VSQEVVEMYRGAARRAVTISQTEADEIGQFLSRSLKADDFFMGGRYQCVKCDRTLTFYDVFQAGRKEHGDEHMRRILAGDEYHIQVARQDQTLLVPCTSCGTANSIGYLQGHQYHGENYCYA
jgi:hypothetical protein